MSGDAFAIRPMRSGDVERVLEIAAALKNTPHWPRSAYLTAFDPHAQPRRIALVVVETASDSPIGFAIANVVPPGAELETVAVAADHQRQGWGRRLLERIFEELRRAGATEVWLEVRVSNMPAIGLYRRAGFVEKGVRRAYYADPAEDASVMGLTIT